MDEIDETTCGICDQTTCDEPARCALERDAMAYGPFPGDVSAATDDELRAFVEQRKASR